MAAGRIVERGDHGHIFARPSILHVGPPSARSLPYSRHSAASAHCRSRPAARPVNPRAAAQPARAVPTCRRATRRSTGARAGARRGPTAASRASCNRMSTKQIWWVARGKLPEQVRDVALEGGRHERRPLVRVQILVKHFPITRAGSCSSARSARLLCRGRRVVRHHRGAGSGVVGRRHRQRHHGAPDHAPAPASSGTVNLPRCDIARISYRSSSAAPRG